jgi:hypothetical protein
LIYLSISLGLVAFEATLPPGDGSLPVEKDRRWFSATFEGVHTIYINPIVTAIGVLSLLPEARTIVTHRSPSALSLVGLGFQATSFTLVGISWLFRLTIPHEYWRTDPAEALVSWYQLVGWAAVDNLVFAFVQAVLLVIALRQRRSDGVSEIMPLLG